MINYLKSCVDCGTQYILHLKTPSHQDNLKQRFKPIFNIFFLLIMVVLAQITTRHDIYKYTHV